MIPNFSSGLIYYFKLYRRYVGRKFYIFVVLSFLVGILDSVGITAVIPLISINMDSGGGNDKVSKAVSLLFQSVGVEHLFLIFLYS